MSKKHWLIGSTVAVLAVAAGWGYFAEQRPAKTNDTQVHVSKVKPHVKAASQKVTAVAKPSTIVKNSEVDTYLKSLHFTGTALIVRRGQTVLRKAYGETNRQTHQPNQTNTTYYIGSAQKALIATAILQLQERGKLKVSDPIDHYLPGFPNGKAIKLTNLLHHTSGLKGHTEQNKAVTPKQLVKDIEKQGVTQQPGTWHYLDSNYTVLAYLVEKLSGESLNNYLRTNILNPANMQNTGTYETFKQSQASVGYAIRGGKYVKPSLPDLSQIFGVGNMYMTVTDMYRFDKALMNDQLIKASSRKEMLTPGSSSTYGMGFYVDPASYNSHGVLSGWNVSNSFTHSGKTYIVLMSNVQNNIPSYGKVNARLYELLNNAE